MNEQEKALIPKDVIIRAQKKSIKAATLIMFVVGLSSGLADAFWGWEAIV